MGLTQVGQQKPFTHTHTYPYDVSDAFMIDEQRQFESAARDLGIEMSVIRDGNRFEFGFSDRMDWTRFRVALFGDDMAPYSEIFTVRFEPDTSPAYKQAWLDFATDLLDRSTLDYQLIMDGENPKFAFSTVTEHTTFAQAVDWGAIHRGAMNTMATGAVNHPFPHN